MENSGQFQKGQSGNPHGRKVEKIWREAVLKAVLRRVEGTGSQRRLDQVADALVAAGSAGDVSAIREIGDRLDGKAVQAIASEDGGPLQISIVRFTEESK